MDICFPLRRLTLLALLVLICICVKSEVVYHTLILCHRTTTSFTLLILVRGSGKIAATVLYPCFLILDPCISSLVPCARQRQPTVHYLLHNTKVRVLLLCQPILPHSPRDYSSSIHATVFQSARKEDLHQPTALQSTEPVSFAAPLKVESR